MAERPSHHERIVFRAPGPVRQPQGALHLMHGIRASYSGVSAEAAGTMVGVRIICYGRQEKLANSAANVLLIRTARRCKARASAPLDSHSATSSSCRPTAPNFCRQRPRLCNDACVRLQASGRSFRICRSAATMRSPTFRQTAPLTLHSRRQTTPRGRVCCNPGSTGASVSRRQPIQVTAASSSLHMQSLPAILRFCADGADRRILVNDLDPIAARDPAACL